MKNPVILEGDQLSNFLSDIGEKMEKVLNEKVRAVQIEEPVTVDIAAKHLKCSKNHLYRLIREGFIPDQYVHNLGNQKRFFLSELNELMKSKDNVKNMKVA